MDNPFLRDAMNMFNGFKVSEKWQERLKESLRIHQVADFWGDVADRFAPAIAYFGKPILAIAEAYNTVMCIALVSCDMAFEDGQ